jgi:serine/threonine protein kinase
MAIAISHEAGVVNCDIKPDNLMVGTRKEMSEGKEQETTLVKLIDQGLAFDYKNYDENTAGGKGGTPNYMSPELFMGKKISPASDVYAMGVMIMETLLGDFGKEWADAFVSFDESDNLNYEASLMLRKECWTMFDKDSFKISDADKNKQGIPDFYCTHRPAE